MTLTMLECFVAAMETLNFTTAGQNMHITQPAFSRNIAALENELGFPLFIRSKQNGLSATPAGRELYHGLKGLQSEFDQLLRSATRTSRGEQGKLVIGILNGVCVDSMTMAAIQTFRERYPQVEMQMICYPFKSLIDSVAQGEIDTCLVLSSAVKSREDLRYKDIVQVENSLGVPSHLHCDPNAVHSLKEFENEVFLLSEDAPELNQLLVAACRRAGFEPKTKTAPDFETKMLWIEFGQGISVNSKEHYIKNSPYVDFVKVREIGPDCYAIIWQKDNNNPTISMFGSIFAEIMRSKAAALQPGKTEDTP